MKEQPDIVESAEAPGGSSMEDLQQRVANLEALVVTLQAGQVSALADSGGTLGVAGADPFAPRNIPSGRALPAGDADYQVLIWDEDDWTGDGDNPKWKVDYPRAHT